jgi:hypothetical protein
MQSAARLSSSSRRIRQATRRCTSIGCWCMTRSFRPCPKIKSPKRRFDIGWRLGMRVNCLRGIGCSSRHGASCRNCLLPGSGRSRVCNGSRVPTWRIFDVTPPAMTGRSVMQSRFPEAAWAAVSVRKTMVVHRTDTVPPHCGRSLAIAVPQVKQSPLQLSLGKPASSGHHTHALFDVVYTLERIRLE